MLMRIINILLVGALLNLTIGCSSDKEVPTAGTAIPDNNGTSRLEPIQGSPQIAFESPNPVYTTLLPNGVTVDVLSIERNTQNSIVTLRYWSDGNEPIDRILVVPSSMLGVSLYDQNGSNIYGHQFALESANCVKQTTWTPQDQLEITYSRSGSAITIGLNLNGATHTIEFADDEEIALAVQLYTEEMESPGLDLSGSESDLLQRYMEMVAFLGDGGSFAGNTDAVTTENLMVDRGFVWRLIGQDKPDAPTMFAGCGLIGDIAAAVSGVCFFPPGPWTVACIPAAGIGLACGLAGILDAIF